MFGFFNCQSIILKYFKEPNYFLKILGFGCNLGKKNKKCMQQLMLTLFPSL